MNRAMPDDREHDQQKAIVGDLNAWHDEQVRKGRREDIIAGCLLYAVVCEYQRCGITKAEVVKLLSDIWDNRKPS